MTDRDPLQNVVARGQAAQQAVDALGAGVLSPAAAGLLLEAYRQLSTSDLRQLRRAFESERPALDVVTRVGLINTIIAERGGA